MVNERRTPLMVAATYGSIDVMKPIISLSDVDINRPCRLDKSTALHCAASVGAENVVDVVAAHDSVTNFSESNGLVGTSNASVNEKACIILCEKYACC